MALISTLTDNFTYKTILGEDEVIIGNEKNKLAFEPHIKLTKWNKENFLSIRYDGISGTPTLVSGQVKLANTDQEFYILPIDDTTLKFGVNFLKKPISNKIVFQLEGWEEFDFFYQPPLANVNPDGSYWEDNGHGGIRSCPANVGGSYAVYHKTKRDHIVGQTNYMCGKFGHDYRPKYTDSNGWSVWCDLFYDLTNGQRIVTLPPDFWTNAKYPIKANDNYGYTSIGAKQNIMFLSANLECIVIALRAAPANGTLNYLMLALRSVTATDTIKTAVYNDVVGLPVTRLGYDTNTTTIPTTNPIVAFTQSADNYNLAITSGTSYWAGFGNNANRNVYIAHDSGSPGYIDHYADDVTTPPAIWTDYTYDYSNNKFISIYATYTPSGGAIQPMLTLLGVGV